jgi:UDP-N-acetylmuramate dehydrogenase
MRVDEQVPLASVTTFRIGGPAALLITVEDEAELEDAYALARSSAREREAYILGEGSNVLAADAGTERAVITLAMRDVAFEQINDDIVLVHADAGVGWDTLVTQTTEQNLCGLENLAGIPGTVGASPVQNIGAYGREIADTLARVRVFDPLHNTTRELTREACAFGYRDSRFKRAPGLCITRVTFRLSRTPAPHLEYPDVQRYKAEYGDESLNTPAGIAQAIRNIRSKKFPDLTKLGTAGSFFKNPVITPEHFAELKQTYPELPGYVQQGSSSGNGMESAGVKIPLAWILDHVLSLRGYTRGPARLFEQQPLVLVAEVGAVAHDVDALAEDVHARVHDATHIFIEREVQTLT